VTGLERVLQAVVFGGSTLASFDLGATGEMGEEGAAVLLTHLEGWLGICKNCRLIPTN
jgi:hypothetical protein